MKNTLLLLFFLMVFTGSIAQYKLTVTVTDQNSNPLQGVAINLWDSEFEIIKTQMSDADGKAVFENMANGSFYYTAETNSCYEDYSEVYEHSILMNNIDLGEVLQMGPFTDDSVVQQDNVLTANASGEGISYKWFREDSVDVFATTKEFKATIAGSYYVEITNSNCNIKLISDNYIVTEAHLGFQQNKDLFFAVYPNPVSENLVLQMKNDFNNVLVEVVNMQGQVVMNSRWNAQQTYNMNVAQLPSGLYFLNVNGDNSFNTIRFVKK